MFVSGPQLVTIVATVICEQLCKKKVEQKGFIMDKIRKGLGEHWSFGHVNEENKNRVHVVLFVPTKYD
jgi:hypothetical protein